MKCDILSSFNCVRDDNNSVRLYDNRKVAHYFCLFAFYQRIYFILISK